MFQAAAKTDQELGGIAHRAGLLHREDLRRVEASAADRNDERLSQLPYHLSGEYAAEWNKVWTVEIANERDDPKPRVSPGLRDDPR